MYKNHRTKWLTIAVMDYIIKNGYGGSMGFRVEKDWMHEGIRCVVIMMEMGYRCGYIGIDKTHCLYGVGYGERADVLQKYIDNLKESDVEKRGVVDVFCWDGEEVYPSILFNVHGGITYSGKGDYLVKSDLWWFGYDCNHLGDAKDLSEIKDQAIMEMEARCGFGGVVRTLEYCISECESLANQISAVEVV